MDPKINTILIIDDEIKILLGLRGLLERGGYKVLTSDNSPDGIKIARERLPDLIICDIMLPILDGFKIKNIMVANPLTRDIPFMFLSARAAAADKLKGFELGADDYIVKPFDPKELLIRVDSLFSRITKTRHLALEEIKQQNENIQDEVSKNISHELRTPMALILLTLDVIKHEKSELPEEIKNYVDSALLQANRLHSLIDDMTFLSNFDMSPLAHLRRIVDFRNDVILPVTLRKDLYSNKKPKLELTIAEGVLIHAPRHEFSMVVSHLADNAMKFGPHGLSVKIDLVPNGDGGCIFTVTDDGPGIPTNLQEKVFERYYQVSQGDARQFGGIGVGLTIARIISRSLGGDVVFLPTVRGCCIQMTLPPAAVDIP